MNPETPPVIEEQAKSILGALEPSPMSEGKGWKRIVSAPVKVLWGMFFAQSMLGGLLVLGWTQRFMQRTVLKQWWDAGGQRTGKKSFAEFLKSDSRTHGHLNWPNWFAQPTAGISPPVAETPEMTDLAKKPDGFGVLLGSFFLNLKLGLQGFFNVALFTLPGCVLMSLGWYDGWQNSFNKGYESFYVGIAVSWLGIFLFMAAMFYVPMAQARQASTGRWQSFYQFKLVWTIVRRQWLFNVGLAALYSLASLPLLWLSAAPMYFPQIADNPKPPMPVAAVVVAVGLMLVLGFVAAPLVIWRLARRKGRRSFAPLAWSSVLALGIIWTVFLPGIFAPKNLEALPASKIASLLSDYYFWAAPIFLTAFVFLRWMAARIYAAGVLKAVQSGAVTEEMLAENEWRALHQLDLLRLQPEKPRHFFVKLIAWTGTRVGRIAAGFATALIWFTFVAQIYVRFFINYPGTHGWLNQSLAQLPWFRPLPARLYNFWGELFLTAFLIFIGWLGWKAVGRLRRFVSN